MTDEQADERQLLALKKPEFSQNRRRIRRGEIDAPGGDPIPLYDTLAR